MDSMKNNVLSSKNKPLNRPRKSNFSAVISDKKNDCLSDDLFKEIAHLSKSINEICHERHITIDEILKTSNSTLGKLYQLFISLKDHKDQLLHQKVFNDFICQNTEGLITKLNQINKNPMNFIQFIHQIQQIAKENELNKEYLYNKILRQKDFIKSENQNNNAFDSSSISHNILLNEYNKDISRLKHYFKKHSEKSEDNGDYQMTCSTFIQCICEQLKFNKVNIRLELNGLFYQIQSLLVHQGVYIPATVTIDFHGFLLCLQHISRRFHFNLRSLIKELINKNSK